jgi:hypothetical protein
MLIVFLTGAVIAAAALGDLVRLTGRRAWMILPLVFAAWTFESLPKAQPTTPAQYPDWVLKLKELPEGAVIDTTYQNEMSLHLYYATGHGKPIGEGYISRYPKSVDKARGEFRTLVDNQRWDILRKQWGFKYLVVQHHVPALKALIQEGEIRVYRLAP